MNTHMKNNIIQKLNKNNKRNLHNKVISCLLVVVLLVSVFRISRVEILAAQDLIDWRENDTMDTSLDVVSNKAGDDDLLFEIGVEETGEYELVYYLEEDRKTTLALNNTYDTLEVSFQVQEYDPDNPATPREVTQELIDNSYLAIDYEEAIPSWASYPDTLVDGDTLDFTIERSASSSYPGIAFQMDNKKFLLKWDFGSNLLYVLIDSYENGFIMPVELTNPLDETQTLKILKGLEDFDVSPVYLIEDPDNLGTNMNLTPITSPNDDGYKPGNKPGLSYTFKQPMELNETTWEYEYDTTDLTNIRAIFELEDIGTDDYLDFNLLLQGSTDMRIYDIPDDNGDQTDTDNYVNYTYDATEYEYEIIIVEDKSELANQDTILEWEELTSSRIYNTSIDFQFEETMEEYEFTTYTPEDDFAYTYLDFQMERSSGSEAYLEIQPYQLGSEDELEYVVLYSKIVADELDSTDDLWLKHYQSGSDDDSTINIPVPFRSESSQDAYQIIVNFSGAELKSQVLNYQAIEDDNVPPTTPSIEGVENLYVIPPESDEEEDPAKIQFDLVWDALENSSTTELDNVFINNDSDEKDAVYYEVLVNDVPDMLDDNPFQIFRVYELYFDEDDGYYKMKVHGDTTAEDEASETTNYEYGYNDVNELLRMENIIVYEDDLWTSRIDTEYDEDNDTYTITERTEAEYPYNYEADFEFPGVNYIRIRAITETDGVIGVSEYSVSYPLSLSMLEYEIPIVEDIEYETYYSLDDEDDIGIILNWPAVDVSTYEDNMLVPVDKEVGTVTYCVYLSEDQDSLLYIDDEGDNYTELTVNDEGDIILDNDELQILRGEDEDENGNVMYFELDRDSDSAEDLDVEIEGLDENGNYYVRIVVELDILDTETDEHQSRRGEASSIISVTTPELPDDLNEEDAIPLAPENFEADFLDDSELSAILSWDIPSEVTVEEDTYGFEVLAIEDYRLPDDLDSKDVDLLDIFVDTDMSDREMEAWRIYYVDMDIVLMEYDFDSEVWVELDDSLLVITDSECEIIDDSNSPNQVNYYYVRTVNMLSETPVKASTWIEDTLTTAPVDGPINLRVDYEYDSYDPYSEVVIRFDAPISDESEVDTDYIMDIFVQGEDDLDYVESTRITSSTSKNDTYYSRYLDDDDEGEVGYVRLYYEISGLKAGKAYNIKVRIEDRTNDIEILPDGSESYPLSPFSDSVSSRTEFDQDEYDKEQKYQAYIDYYLEQAEELKQSPYFVIEENEDDDEITVKYRASYIDGFLEMNKDGNYELVGYEYQASTYYIPAEMIESGNDLNITYVIRPKDHYIGIKPYTIGSVITDEIVNVLEDIDSYDSDLEDYYIEIKIMAGEYSGTVYGDDPGSELVNIEVNIIGSEDTEENIDEALEAEMDEVIEAAQDDLIDLLEDELEEGIDDDILTGIVQDVLVEVEEDFGIYGKILFESYLDDSVYTVSELESSLTVGLVPYDIDTVNVVYSKVSGDWKVETTMYYNNMYNITTDEPGSFIAVEQLSQEDLDNLYSQDVLDIINKYKLTDIFTSYELNHWDETVTNLQMIQTFARLIGADADTDDEDYLEDEGLDVPYLTDYSKATNEDAAYLYVQTYTSKKQMNLDAVTIRDYNAIEDIDDVKEIYQDTVLKGVSLDIVELDNSRLLPAESITMEKFLNLIEDIEE